VAIAELGSGHTRDLWLDVQPPEADEVSAEHVRGGEAKKQRHKEEKESKHAEKLHKNGKQCRLHLQVLPWGPALPSPCAALTIPVARRFDCSPSCFCDEVGQWEMGLRRRLTASLLTPLSTNKKVPLCDEAYEGCTTVVGCTLVLLMSRAGTTKPLKACDGPAAFSFVSIIKRWCAAGDLPGVQRARGRARARDRGARRRRGQRGRRAGGLGAGAHAARRRAGREGAPCLRALLALLPADQCEWAFLPAHD